MTQRRIYQSDYPFFLTTVTEGRRWVFDDESLTKRFNDIIHEACTMHGFSPVAFCINPDHLHLLVWQTERTDLNWYRAMSPQQRRESDQHGLENPRWENNIPTQRAFSKARWNVSHLMQSMKGTFSRSVHEGRIWQPRFNSRIVDSEQRFENTVEYIRWNYRKHRLPEQYGRSPYVFIAHDVHF